MNSVPSKAETDDTRLPTRAVLARYDICDRTLDRWLADPDMKFPRPIIINRRRYFVLSEIEEWERLQPRKKYASAA
jgi:predicted DNA-binding transcriptional regulator AlpA